MASVLDVIRATRDAPAADTELVGPPELPKKRSVADVVRAAREAPSESAPPPPVAGAIVGAGLGGEFRREKERAETPEFLRRPEEPEPERPPRPDEVPPLLKRPERLYPGDPGVPTRLEEAALTGVRIGAPLATGIVAGALTGPGAPVVVPLLSATVGTAAEYGAQKYEQMRGLRREMSPGQVAFQGMMSGIPGVPLPATWGPVARTAARAGEGLVMGTGGVTGSTLIEEGRFPTAGELAYGGTLGTVLGTAGGAVEAKGIPYLHERAPGFVGPRETPSGWQLRATRKSLATSAEQLAGETTLPPVDAPRMVTGPGETIGPGGQTSEFIGPPEPLVAPGEGVRLQAARDWAKRSRVIPKDATDVRFAEDRVGWINAEGRPEWRTYPRKVFEAGPAEPVRAPSEFVGPPAPEMTPHPVGSDVQFRELGEQERTTPGRIVAHEVDPETGQTRIAVEDVNGTVRQRPMDDVELAPDALPEGEFVGPPEPPTRPAVPLPNTAIRTPEGEPQKMYHGSPRAFEKFSSENLSSDALYGPGIYLTSDPTVAGEYADSSRVVNQPMSPADRRAHFTPGRIIPSEYVNEKPIKVLAYHETPDGSWAAHVVSVNEDGSPIYGEPSRIHRTDPTYPPQNAANIRPSYVDVRNPLDMRTPEGQARYRALDAEHEGDRAAVRDALQAEGYDGIIYDGGKIMGDRPHDVVVAFHPDQVHEAFPLEAAARYPQADVGPTQPPGAPPPPPPPGGAAPPPGGEAPRGEMRPETAFEPPPEERGPFGQRPTFRRYPGLGEALTGEEIGPQLGADPQRMTRAIESVDREFGDVFDEPTRDRLKQQIRDNQARFEYLGRGKQTVERTQGLGRDLLFDLDKAKLEPLGTTYSPEQTAALKNHLVSLDQGVVAAQEAFDAHPTPENGLILQKASQDYVDAFNIYRARGAEAGRTVNLYKASAEDLASGNQRLMLAALKRGVPPDKLAEIIRTTRPEQAKARAEMLMAVTERGPWHKRLRSALQTIYISNILSGPPPHERNFLGNSINSLLLQPIAKGFGALHERVTGVSDAERTIRLGEAGKHYVGLYDGTPDAVYKAFEVLKSGYTQEQAVSYNLPIHELGVGRHPALRTALNIVPRGLGGADMFQRVLGQEASLNGQAYTKARNEALVAQAGHNLPAGVSFAEHLDQRYDFYKKNPTSEMMAQAADEATRGVFQEQDAVARYVQFLRDKVPGGWMLAPFVTTSTNLGKLGLHWTPAGYLMPSTRGKVAGLSRRSQVIHLGEAHAGTAAMLLAPAVLWAMSGKLHGAGPMDPDEFANWRQTHVPYSLELPNGLAISFQQLPGLNVPLSAVGNGWDRGEEIRRQKGSVGPEDAADIFLSVLAGAGQSVLDQPYMQGISNLIGVMRHPMQLAEVLRHPTEPKEWPDVNRMTKDISTGFVPASGMLRWIEQIGDPTIREGKTIPQKIEGMIPGGIIPGIGSENVPPKLDEFGQPIEIKKAGGAWGRALNPIETEYVTRDPLREELETQGMMLSPPSEGVPLKGESPYTPEEALVIRKAKGQQVRAELEDLIASDTYQDADPETRQTLLRSVLGRTRGAMGKRARGLREEGLDVESLRWGE